MLDTYGSNKKILKFLNKKISNIFFAKIENDGFSLGAQRNPILENDIPKIEAQIEKFFNGDETELISATKEKIRRNNYKQFPPSF